MILCLKIIYLYLHSNLPNFKLSQWLCSLRHFCVTWVKTVQQFLSTVSKRKNLSPLLKHFRINLIPVACNNPLYFTRKSQDNKKSKALCRKHTSTCKQRGMISKSRYSQIFFLACVSITKELK